MPSTYKIGIKMINEVVPKESAQAFHNFTTLLKFKWLLEDWGKMHFKIQLEDDFVWLVVNFTKEKMLKCSSGYFKTINQNTMSISSNHKKSGSRFVLISLDL